LHFVEELKGLVPPACHQHQVCGICIWADHGLSAYRP
jgi:hypothetical protein